MKRKFRFNQKIMNCIGAAALIFVVLAMIISTWNVKRSVAAEVRVAAKRDRCGKLCEELKEAADYLSEQARLYAVTGDNSCLERYWEEVHSGKRRDGVVKRLGELGLDDRDMRLVESAKKNSDPDLCSECRGGGYDSGRKTYGSHISAMRRSVCGGEEGYRPVRFGVYGICC